MMKNCNTWLSVIESATSFQALVLVSRQIAKRVAVLLIEEILARRGQQQTHWSNCPMCGHKLHSKGLAKRQITTLVGVIHFSRRTEQCPNRRRIGLVALLDAQLQFGQAPTKWAAVTKTRLLVGCFRAI